MIKQLTLAAALIVCFNESIAQPVFQGKITYQRKMNIHRQFDDWEDENGFKEQFMKQIPKFDTRNYVLSFNANTTKYEAIKQEEDPKLMMGGGLPGTETQVLSDLAHGKFSAQKKLYEQVYFVQDSLKKFTWKIHDEVRNIAGYSCRKATTRINDSVVVVAFYTETIQVSGGPELFNGLPGMVLEIAVPRLYTTWVAQNVNVQAVEPAVFTLAEKGKKTNLTDMAATLKAVTKNWGKFADKNIWWSSL